MSYFRTNSAGNLTWCEAVNPYHLPGELSRCPACGPKSNARYDELLADMRDLLRRFYYDGNGSWYAQVKAAHIDGLREKWGEK